MIDNLDKLKFNKEELEYIKDNLNYDTLVNVSFNYELVNSNIELLNSIGLTDLEDIFVTFTEFFLNDKEVNLKKFSKFNISALVSLINEDFTVFNEINNI